MNVKNINETRIRGIGDKSEDLEAQYKILLDTSIEWILDEIITKHQQQANIDEMTMKCLGQTDHIAIAVHDKLVVNIDEPSLTLPVWNLYTDSANGSGTQNEMCEKYEKGDGARRTRKRRARRCN